MKQNLIKFALFALVGGMFFTAFLFVAGSVAQAQKTAAVNIGTVPTLGSYPDGFVTAGGNTIVTSSAPPSGAVRVTAKTSANFKGVLSVNAATGAVRVTGAMPAGTYIITITAFDSTGGTAARNFTLRVLQPESCAPFSNANFTPAPGSPVLTQTGPQFPEAGDFNNDGITDIVVANFNSDSVSLLTGTGGGGFNAAVNIPTGGVNPQFITVSDFNGDGNQDFAVGNITSSTISVLLGNGTGGFAQAAGSPFASGGFDPRGIIAADFNGDNRIDLAVANSTTSNVSIFTGNGAGGFTAGASVSVGSSPFGIVKGFFNADANIDLVTFNFDSADFSILLGNGAGGFTSTTPPTVITGAGSGSVADFNNDGFQDIAVDSLTTNNLNILLGSGAGTFTLGTPVNVGFTTFGITAADFNGDGNQDLLASQLNNPGTVSLQLGTGNGAFTSGGNIGTLATPRGIAVADYNNDGRLDFAVAESNTASGNRVSSFLAGCPININNNAVTGGDSLPNAQRGAPFNTVVTVTGGTPPLTFSATGLPMGLMINPMTGVISGTPTEAGIFTPRIFVTDSIAQMTAKSFQLIVVPTVAAGVTVAGRVRTTDGTGVRNAVVTLTDSNGNTRTAQTGSFGYYRFEEVEAGQTYIVSVASKRFTFTTQVVSVSDSITDLDFTGQ